MNTSDTQHDHQIYANKCVLKSAFGDAVQTQDLNTSENKEQIKAIMYQLIWKNIKNQGNCVV